MLPLRLLATLLLPAYGASAPMLHGAGSHTRPPPKWQQTWNMSRSTVIMPCNTSGWFDPAEAARYGLVDIDWSNARAQWARHRPMDDDARLATEVAMVKAINPQTHVWICAPEHEAPCAAVTPPPLTCRTEPPAAPLLRPCG